MKKAMAIAFFSGMIGAIIACVAYESGIYKATRPATPPAAPAPVTKVWTDKPQWTMIQHGSTNVVSIDMGLGMDGKLYWRRTPEGEEGAE